MRTVFDKVRELRNILKVRLTEKTNKELLRIIDHINRYNDGSRKHLTSEERAFYDFFLKEKYNPKTLILWFRALNYPRFIQEQLRSGELSLRQARDINRDYRIKTDKQIESEINHELRTYFNNIKFKEYIDEGLDNVRRRI